eukprot:CAMPEP_0179361030 /NCGR_PEP_ID=MMETSP0797-20121207/80281_1 /TAXON_ID=47934 /ORGANISM="Dinophysis acuminata, Strain DAEP01" /LENGTH=442 /DNA_ID=CAMNT_0021076401 /DNA_START=73 /DNA_END=1397 /DNA_ORIENTATION=+
MTRGASSRGSSTRTGGPGRRATGGSSARTVNRCTPPTARAAAEALKEQGNALFASQKYEKAADKWTRALCVVESYGAEELQAALYANRAEARLRQQKWGKALDDATAALQREPTHEKALLRAAVAMKEMRGNIQALDFVQQCLDANPKHPQALNMISELHELIRKEHNVVTNKPSKLQEEWINRDVTEESLPRAFDTKDATNKKGWKAFTGYGQNKDGTVEKPPLSALPHNRFQMSPEQRQQADFTVQQMRDKAEEEKNKAKFMEKAYPWAKDVYKDRYMEDMSIGKAASIEASILPAEATRKAQEAEADASKDPPKPAPLKAEGLAPPAAGQPVAALGGQVIADIDKMFASFTEKPPPKDLPDLSSDAATKDRLEKAKALLKEKGVTPEDLRKETRTATDSATAAGQSLANAVQKYQEARAAGDTKAVGAAETALEKEFST